MGTLSTWIAPLWKGTSPVLRRISVTSCTHLRQLGQRRNSSLISWLGRPHRIWAGPEAQQWPLAPPVAPLWPDPDQRLLRLLEQLGPVKKDTVKWLHCADHPHSCKGGSWSLLRCNPGMFPLLTDGTSWCLIPRQPTHIRRGELTFTSRAQLPHYQA